MRYPTPRQWQLFERYKSSPPPLHPLTFLQRWEISYPELAKLAAVSRSTVEHWFSTGTGQRTPAARHCRRLAEIDFLWRHAEQIPDWLLRRWSGDL